MDLRQISFYTPICSAIWRSLHASQIFFLAMYFCFPLQSEQVEEARNSSSANQVWNSLYATRPKPGIILVVTISNSHSIPEICLLAWQISPRLHPELGLIHQNRITCSDSFTLPDSDTDTDSDTDSKPNGYIVLCWKCSHCTDSGSDSYSLFLYRTGIRVRLRQCKWDIGLHMSHFSYACKTEGEKRNLPLNFNTCHKVWWCFFCTSTWFSIWFSTRLT